MTKWSNFPLRTAVMKLCKSSDEQGKYVFIGKNSIH